MRQESNCLQELKGKENCYKETVIEIHLYANIGSAGDVAMCSCRMMQRVSVCSAVSFLYLEKDRLSDRGRAVPGYISRSHRIWLVRR